MGNEFSSKKTNIEKKLAQMSDNEFENYDKIYIDLGKLISEERKKRNKKKSKAGNSKTSNKSIVSNKKKTPKSSEKKSKSGGKKPTSSSTHRKINASKKFIIEFLEKKKIQYVKGYDKTYYEKLVIENRLITKVEEQFKKKKNK